MWVHKVLVQGWPEMGPVVAGQLFLGAQDGCGKRQAAQCDVIREWICSAGQKQADPEGRNGLEDGRIVVVACELGREVAGERVLFRFHNFLWAELGEGVAGAVSRGLCGVCVCVRVRVGGSEGA